MPNTITSPEYSFVNFNSPTLYCGDEAPFPLPAPIGVGFQVLVADATDPAIGFRLGICSADCDLIHMSTILGTDLCFNNFWTNLYSGAASWPTADKYPVMANTCYGYYSTLSEIPYPYATEADLLAAISEAIGVELTSFDDFETCCAIRNDMCVLIQDVDGTFYGNILTNATSRMAFVDTTLDVSNYVDEGNCFRYCVVYYTGEGNPQVLECSQLFVVDSADCYRTTIKYYGDDNQFDFVYRNDTYNLVRLPMYLRKPVFPTEEKVFKKSDGTYKRQWAMVEKEWDVTTDYFPEWMHEMLTIALKHDNVIVTSPDAGLTAQALTQLGSYDIQWQEKEDIYAPAGFKLRQPVTGMNRSCRPSSACCIPGSITFGTDEIYFGIGSNATGVQVRYKLNTDTEWTTRDVEAATSPLAFNYMPVEICQNTYWEVQMRAICGTSNSAWSQTEIYRHPLACGYPVVNSVILEYTGTIIGPGGVDNVYAITIALMDNNNAINYSYDILNELAASVGSGITPENIISSSNIVVTDLDNTYTYTIDANCAESTCTITGVINVDTSTNEVVSWTQVEVS